MQNCLCVLFVTVVITAIRVQACLNQLPKEGDNRDKLYVGELGEFIALMEHEDSVLDLMSRYLNYGCYCGYHGSGIPKDKSDHCCFCHDKCYNDLETPEESNGLAFIFKTYQYKFNFTSQVVSCQKVSDEDLDANENERLFKKCLCDLQLAMCLCNAEFNEEHNHLESGSCDIDAAGFSDIEKCPSLPWNGKEWIKSCPTKKKK